MEEKPMEIRKQQPFKGQINLTKSFRYIGASKNVTGHLVVQNISCFLRTLNTIFFSKVVRHNKNGTLISHNARNKK